MMTAAEMIKIGKNAEFKGLMIHGTKKIKGHTRIELTIHQNNIYYLSVWGSGNSGNIETIDLRMENADDRLAKYI